MQLQLRAAQTQLSGAVTRLSHAVNRAAGLQARNAQLQREAAALRERAETAEQALAAVKEREMGTREDDGNAAPQPEGCSTRTEQPSAALKAEQVPAVAMQARLVASGEADVSKQPSGHQEAEMQEEMASNSPRAAMQTGKAEVVAAQPADATVNAHFAHTPAEVADEPQGEDGSLVSQEVRRLNG